MDFKFPINWYFEIFLEIKPEGGVSLKNPHGQGGGFKKCPCLSTRGEGGSKKPKKLSTWFVDDPFPFIIKKIAKRMILVVFFDVVF